MEPSSQHNSTSFSWATRYQQHAKRLECQDWTKAVLWFTTPNPSHKVESIYKMMRKVWVLQNEANATRNERHNRHNWLREMFFSKNPFNFSYQLDVFVSLSPLSCFSSIQGLYINSCLLPKEHASHHVYSPPTWRGATFIYHFKAVPEFKFCGVTLSIHCVLGH